MMTDELQKALISKDSFTIKMSTNRTESDSLEFLTAQFHNYKWSLLEVVEIGDSDLTKLFLEGDNSINVNYHGDRDWTALHEAVYNFDVDNVKLLLECNADPNSMDDSSTTPIGSLYVDHDPYSDHDDGLSIIKMLSDVGANAVTYRDNVKVLQVSNILMMGTAEEVEIILNMNIDLTVQYDNGDTVARYLAGNGQPNVWKMMRDREFAVNVRNICQETPLWCAANVGVVEAVEILLSKGADVNAADRRNFTPVYAATKSYAMYRDESWKDESWKCIMLLLEYGADIQVSPMQDGPPVTIIDILLKLEDDNLCKLMSEHLALYEELGTPIIDIIRSQIESIEGFKKYFNFCKRVLEAKMYGSETAFDLLTCNEEKLVPYMRNEELLKILFDCCDGMKFMVSGYYYRLLHKRLTKARDTAKLKDSAAVVIGELMQIDHNCHSIIVDNIMSYLENQDLVTLLSLF